MPRTHWTPSPCGRLSRPPWWRVTATTTTDPPPRPGGHSGRCACPEPTNRVRRAPPGRSPRSLIRRSAGPASSYTPGASPRATATRRAASPTRTVTGRTRRSPRVTRTEHPKQPIAASFEADDTYRGFDHWYRFPTPFRLATAPGPLATDRRSMSRAACRPTPHLRPRCCPPASPDHYSGRRRGPSPRPVIRRLAAQDRLCPRAADS